MVGNIHLISFLNFFQVAVKRYNLDYFWDKHRANLMVLKFVFVKSLKNRLTLDYLQQLRVVEPTKGPRPFMRISDYMFKKILSDSKTNVKFVEA